MDPSWKLGNVGPSSGAEDDPSLEFPSEAEPGTIEYVTPRRGDAVALPAGGRSPAAAVTHTAATATPGQPPAWNSPEPIFVIEIAGEPPPMFPSEASGRDGLHDGSKRSALVPHSPVAFRPARVSHRSHWARRLQSLTPRARQGAARRLAPLIARIEQRRVSMWASPRKPAQRATLAATRGARKVGHAVARAGVWVQHSPGAARVAGSWSKNFVLATSHSLLAATQAKWPAALEAARAVEASCRSAALRAYDACVLTSASVVSRLQARQVDSSRLVIGVAAVSVMGLVGAYAFLKEPLAPRTERAAPAATASHAPPSRPAVPPESPAQLRAAAPSASSVEPPAAPASSRRPPSPRQTRSNTTAANIRPATPQRPIVQPAVARNSSQPAATPRPAPAAPPAQEAEQPPPQFRGTLVVNSTPPGARVYVNGAVIGVTPLVLQDVPVGSRAVRVDLQGYERWSSVLQIVANEQTVATATLRPAAGR